MNKYSIRLGLLTLAFSLMFFILSSGTKAETNAGPKKDLVSELHIESTYLLNPTNHSVDGKIIKNNPSREFLIPVKKEINAFIGYASPVHQDRIGSTDARRNYGTVIGFRFTLR
jgi:hypothetical protein